MLAGRLKCGSAFFLNKNDRQSGGAQQDDTRLYSLEPSLFLVGKQISTTETTAFGLALVQQLRLTTPSTIQVGHP
jgi:hypothetical protein